MMLVFWDIRFLIHLAEKCAVAAKGTGGWVSLNKLCGTFSVTFTCLPGTSAQRDRVFLPGSFPAQPSLDSKPSL